MLENDYANGVAARAKEYSNKETPPANTQNADGQEPSVVKNLKIAEHKIDEPALPPVIIPESPSTLVEAGAKTTPKRLQEENWRRWPTPYAPETFEIEIPPTQEPDSSKPVTKIKFSPKKNDRGSRVANIEPQKKPLLERLGFFRPDRRPGGNHHPPRGLSK